MIDINSSTINLQLQARSIKEMIAGISPEQAIWKPDPESWSILEVINHLYDEERFDFRVRLDIILEQQAGQTWPPIDPAGWVTARGYNERDLDESLANFKTEREKSVAWLQQLKSPDWNLTYQTSFGPMRANEMLAAWVAHDLLHLRQLVELKYSYLAAQAGSFGVRYAGEW